MSAMLITRAQMVALIENGQRSKEVQRRDQLFDPEPVVKLFTPDAHATWLLSEIDPNETNIPFGLLMPLSVLIYLWELRKIDTLWLDCVESVKRWN